MLRHIRNIAGGCLLLLAALSTPVAAADDAEFAFNLLTDIAPILALFGDEFAKQFTSESLTWVDHLIFAMVPLGIVSAITGAIRVQGMPVAKAFIGRSRENRALAEIELMSSTSGEVCELFNGSSIVRAMGKPRIGQILVFPDEYNRLENEHKPLDEALVNSKPKHTTEKERRDTSCGIHSLQSAASQQARLMEYKPYSSHSADIVQGWMDSASRFHRDFRRSPLDTLKGSFRSASSGSTCSRPISLENDLESAPVQSGQPSPPVNNDNERTALCGPPNLRLNLSSDQFNGGRFQEQHEIMLAAFAAVILQTSLIVIAAVTAYNLSPKSSSLWDSRIYGFPCYAAGSILLSIGTGLCSVIIEHSTTEHSWAVVGKEKAEQKSAPRLLWIQQNQSVNDQSFKGYAILAGPKRQVVISRRNDDGGSRKYSPSHLASLSHGDAGNPLPNITLSSGSSESKGGNSIDKKNKDIWQWLTVGAALSAGVGFTAQFMGLRGLAFPCSIAQLGSIFLMTLIRAGIRRRLGRVPTHLPALDGFELDFLATQIVFYPGFRNFNPRAGRKNPEKRDIPRGPCHWRVITANKENRDPHFVRSSNNVLGGKIAEQAKQPSTDQVEFDKVKESEDCNHLRMENVRTSLGFKPATSQQLLRVRERLGDLCRFASKSSQSALSLTRSIELFMDTFFPSSSSLQSSRAEQKAINLPSSFSWLIEVGKLGALGVDEGLEMIEIPIRRKKTESKDKWEVDIGRVDAILSLWMASIEAKRLEDLSPRSGDSPADWRRTKAGDDLGYSFYRIIGDNLNDDVLKRDLSWWVDSLVAEQSDAREENNGNDQSGRSGDIVIGFNGYKLQEDAGNRRELGITSKASLQTILAQHLFTSFMWTVVESLPRDSLASGTNEMKEEVEIEGLQAFESDDFTQSWLRPRLRHRKLTKVIRGMESYGLGGATDILLCMIPALSFKRLLPNQAILKLMPRVGSGRGWVEIAICYRKLLETIKAKNEKVSTHDKLNVAAVVYTLDFLSLAYEPYDKQRKPPWELEEELEAIVKQVASDDFATIVERLGPVYSRQNRKELFRDLLGREADGIHALDQEFAAKILGFTWHHRAMFSQENSEPYTPWNERRKEECAKVRDIFGWTPYHYGCLDESFPWNVFMPSSDVWAEQLPTFVDNLGRSPIHIAALAANRDSLESMLDGLSREGRRSVTHSGGLDNMTPLHLVSKNGDLDCLEMMERYEGAQPLTTKDIWGRQAIHIASRLGHDEFTTKLLEMGSRSDEFDDDDKCPVDYFVERFLEKRWKAKENAQDGGNPIEELQTRGSSITDPPEASGMALEYLSKESFDMLLKFASHPDDQYGNKKSLLHIAVEVADDASILQLKGKGFHIEAKDEDGRTPLHYAILHGRIRAFQIFQADFNASLLAKDSCNITALMLAAQRGILDIVREILTAPIPVKVEDVDDSKRTALHHASTGEMAEFLVHEGCSPLATDSDGRTALHTAIANSRKDAALYLLGLRAPDQLQERPFDSNQESLLVTACKSGLSEVIPKILSQKQWAEADLLNAVDTSYGQPPISWACENGYSGAVEQLLQHEGIDVNKTASKWKSYTPLHFAAVVDDTKCLSLLLNFPPTRLDVQSDAKQTPLDRAVSGNCVEAARILLQHPRTSLEQRIRFVRDIISRSSAELHSLISDTLTALLATEFDLCGFLQELYDLKSLPSVKREIDKFTNDLRQGAWQQLKTPYQIAILLHDEELARILTRHDVDQGGLDEDNWSWIDYRDRFRLGESSKSLFDHLKPLDTKPSSYKEPTALIWDQHKESLEVTSEATEGDDGRPNVHEIKVSRASPNFDKGFLRGNHCIPPSKEYFYFEVEVLRNSESRILGIGFCGPTHPSIIDGQMPGWFKGSWAYHGDDGLLFIERSGLSPSSDFGEDGTFKENDVVGVCLYTGSGRGFCTRNGVKMDMGNAFEKSSESFRFRKMYPCVGFDLGKRGEGLEFRVNFDGKTRPFRFKGPFE